MRVQLVAPGPPGHGVVRHAAALARLLRRAGTSVVPSGADVVHAQFTDALWGPDIGRAADAFAAWAAAVREPLVVTLHDVPGGDPDRARDARRCAGYARVVAACTAVVVSAGHEQEKVATVTGRRATVVGLPVEPHSVGSVPAGPRPWWADRATVGVLGFVYPGKGHAEVLDAVARLPDPPRVVAAGAVGLGHDEEWAMLERRAAGSGVDLVLTGTLDDPAMAAAARAATVPVVPGRTVSASGTLATWWGAGRRPLVADGPYAADQARCFPAALQRYSPSGLVTAIAARLADPGPGRLDDPPSWPDVAAGHLRVYRSVHPC